MSNMHGGMTECHSACDDRMTECHEVCDDRMTKCHEVCDDSAFMPTKEFLQKRLCRQRSSFKSVYANKGVPSKAFMPTKEFPL